MAGPLDIQRYPRGLIDLFGMKATGDTPHRLSDVISGEIDLTDLYLNSRTQTFSQLTAIALNATGFVAFNNAQPASNEIWLVYGIGVDTQTTAAATAIKFSVVCFRATASGSPEYVTGPCILGANDRDFIGRQYERPMVMRPGDNLGVVVSTVTGAPAISPRVYVYYAPLLI